jgi:fumarate hydratase subunit beta
LLTGVLFTARDAAHKRLLEEKDLSFLKGQVLYYAGPAPAPKGRASGSAGPTTSGRMDKYTPALVQKSGIIGIVGKGPRDAATKRALKDKTVYFAALGGCGAFMGERILKCEPFLYADLGAEAVYRMEVKDMPLTVALDFNGKDIYERSKK